MTCVSTIVYGQPFYKFYFLFNCLRFAIGGALLNINLVNENSRSSLDFSGQLEDCDIIECLSEGGSKVIVLSFFVVCILQSLG